MFCIQPLLQQIESEKVFVEMINLYFNDCTMDDVVDCVDDFLDAIRARARERNLLCICSAPALAASADCPCFVHVAP